MIEFSIFTCTVLRMLDIIRLNINKYNKRYVKSNEGESYNRDVIIILSYTLCLLFVKKEARG